MEKYTFYSQSHQIEKNVLQSLYQQKEMNIFSTQPQRMLFSSFHCYYPIWMVIWRSLPVHSLLLFYPVGTTLTPNIMQTHKFEMVLHFNGETKRRKVSSFRSVEATIEAISEKFNITYYTSETEHETNTIFENGICLQAFLIA